MDSKNYAEIRSVRDFFRKYNISPSVAEDYFTYRRMSLAEAYKAHTAKQVAEMYDTTEGAVRYAAKLAGVKKDPALTRFKTAKYYENLKKQKEQLALKNYSFPSEKIQLETLETMVERENAFGSKDYKKAGFLERCKTYAAAAVAGIVLGVGVGLYAIGCSKHKKENFSGPKKPSIEQRGDRTIKDYLPDEINLDSVYNIEDRLEPKIPVMTKSVDSVETLDVIIETTEAIELPRYTRAGLIKKTEEARLAKLAALAKKNKSILEDVNFSLTGYSGLADDEFGSSILGSARYIGKDFDAQADLGTSGEGADFALKAGLKDIDAFGVPVNLYGVLYGGKDYFGADVRGQASLLTNNQRSKSRNLLLSAGGHYYNLDGTDDAGVNASLEALIGARNFPLIKKWPVVFGAGVNSSLGSEQSAIEGGLRLKWIIGGTERDVADYIENPMEGNSMSLMNELTEKAREDNEKEKKKEELTSIKSNRNGGNGNNGEDEEENPEPRDGTGHSDLRRKF